MARSRPVEGTNFIARLGVELGYEIVQRRGLGTGLVLVIKIGAKYKESTFRMDLGTKLGTEVRQRLRIIRGTLGLGLGLALGLAFSTICVRTRQPNVFLTGYPTMEIRTTKGTVLDMSRTLETLDMRV